MPDIDMHLLESVTLLSSLNLFVSSESFSLLRQWGLIIVLCFVFVTTHEKSCTSRNTALHHFVITMRYINHMVIHTVLCDRTTLTNNLIPLTV